MTTPRPAEADDSGRIRTVAESAMTASYALSPQELDAIVGDQFADDRQRASAEDDESVFLVTDDDGTVVAVVEGTLRDGHGEIHWLFVDPEHRGRGHATELLDTAIDELHDRGASEVRALALAANREGEAFFERFEFTHVDERDVELGGQRLTQHVYTRVADATAVDVDSTATDEATAFPEDGHATMADGTEVRVDREERRSGTKAPFFVTYVDEGDQQGFFCGSCGATETAMDGMERLECQECGNRHKPDGAEQYDDGYL